MPKLAVTLTNTTIKNSPVRGKPYTLFDGKETGLHVLVQVSGTKTFRLKVKIDGRDRRITLGQFPGISLLEAREKSAFLKSQIRKGIDPTAPIVLDTFGDMVKCFLDTERRTRNRSETRLLKIKQGLDKHVLPYWRDLPILKIKHCDVNKMIIRASEKKEDERGGESGGSYISREIHRYTTWIFEYAASVGKIESLPILKSTLNHIPRHVTEHMRSMAFERVGAFLSDLNDYGGTVIGKLALRFILLTGIRTAELRCLRWAWLNEKERYICVPWQFTKIGKRLLRQGKTGEDFYILLSSQAFKILEKTEKISGDYELVFPSPYCFEKEASDAVVNNSLKRMGWSAEHCGHGFRALFRSEMRKQGADRDHLELCISHEIARDATESAYQRGMNRAFFTERRKIMQDWADLLDQQKRLSE
jgi:integrase